MVNPGMFISDRYEIIEKVGSGGMADVYRAKCHRLNRFVAIKILKPEFSADTTLVTKFRAEAQSVAGLSHPNIVSVYDVGDDGDLHYIVMELVEGITLKKFIEKKGHLDIKEAIGISIQIAQGLEAAHDNHIVHRDIKPQNIIISREGKVKVADFGIAKAATTNTVTQGAVGSVHYLSPEQARGGYSDERSDIYSFGITMYEMLCGKVPFAGDNTVSVALSHIQYEPVPVREVNPAVPFSVNQIVQKCMQKRPENRYHSASELIVDLKRSIMNPDGDFVQISDGISNSPTKHMTKDELAEIKNAVSNPVVPKYEPIKNNSKVLKEEEEELDGGDTKWDKLLFFVVIVVILTFMGVVIYAVVNLMKGFDIGNLTPTVAPTQTSKISGTPTPSPTPRITMEVVKLTNVKGRMLDDAKDLLRRQSDLFTILDGETEYSDTVPAGMVIDQYPAEGADVAIDEVIRLKVSVGPEAVQVQDYTLWNYLDAKISAENDFKVRVEFEPSLTIESNRVIRTIPERNGMLERGQELILVVSRGEAVDTVPGVVGMTLEAAQQLLKSKYFEIGSVTYAGSTKYTAGLVSFQSQAEGNIIPIGTPIDLEVSSGLYIATPTPSPTPSPTPTPSPKPTPTLTPTPVMTGSRFEVKVLIDDKPIQAGDTNVPIKFSYGTRTLYDGRVSYNDLAGGSFTFYIGKDSFPNGSNGTYMVMLEVNENFHKTYDAVFTLK